MANFYKAIERVSFDTSTLTTNYQLLDASGLEQACLFIILTNNSNNVIDISYDGTTDNDTVLNTLTAVIPGGQFRLNNVDSGVWKKGQRIWVKSSGNAAGTLYLSGYYL